MLVGSWAPCASAQALDMIIQLAIELGSTGSGADVIRSTVSASTARASLMVATRLASSEPSFDTRWYENTTSAAVNGVPSANLTPERSLKRQTVGSTSDHSVASAGISLRSR